MPITLEQDSSSSSPDLSRTLRPATNPLPGQGAGVGLVSNTNLAGTTANSVAGGGLGLAPPNTTTAGTSATAPLPTEYPNAPSTTGQPQNRLQLATTAFDTFAKSTAPQYTADLREATQKAAGAGNLGSGMLRTTYGNLANQRALALDTEKQNLINTATAASIGDEQTAQGLGIQQQNANTAQTSALGNLGVAQGTLGLETTKAATAANQGQQSIDIAKQTADINAKVASGQLSVQQGQLELAKLAQSTNADQGQQQLDLAKKTADIDAQYKAGTLTLAQRDQALRELSNTQQFGLATAAQDVATKVQLGQLSIAQAQQALDDKVRSGQLTIDQAKQALDEINSKAARGVAQQNADTNTGQLQLAKESLAQAAQQFGLSLAQQKELATLADKTQNRQLDISSAQGQNSLLLELARIMGTSTTSIDKSFLAAISKALGIGAPTQTAPAASPSAPGAAPGTTPWPDFDPTLPYGGYGSPYGS